MNPVVHFEISYEDPSRIMNFYESAFGWKTQMLGSEMENYVVVTTAIPDAKSGAPAGAINGGFFPEKVYWPAQYPSIVIAVDDIKESRKKVSEERGQVVGEAMPVPGIGLYVSFFDMEGNRFSMLQPGSNM